MTGPDRPSALVYLMILSALAAAPGRAAAGEAPGPGDTDEGFGEDFVTPSESRPVLSVVPGELRASVARGETTTLSLTVRNAGGRTLAWSVESSADWARVEPEEGSLGFKGERKLLVSLDARGLEPGTARAKFDFEAPGAAGGPLSVPLVLEVTRERAPDATREDGVVFTPIVPGDDDDEETPTYATGSGEAVATEPRAGGGFGVRAGMILPSSGDDADYGAALKFDVFYRPEKGNGSKLGWELAFGIGGSDEEYGYVSRPLTGDVNVLFALGGAAKAGGYLLSGLGGVIEPVDDTVTGESYTNYAGSLSLGGGVAFGEGRYDARFVYGILLGSKNVGGQAALSFGVGF